MNPEPGDEYDDRDEYDLSEPCQACGLLDGHFSGCPFAGADLDAPGE